MFKKIWKFFFLFVNNFRIENCLVANDLYLAIELAKKGASKKAIDMIVDYLVNKGYNLYRIDEEYRLFLRKLEEIGRKLTSDEIGCFAVSFLERGKDSDVDYAIEIAQYGDGATKNSLEFLAKRIRYKSRKEKKLSFNFYLNFKKLLKIIDREPTREEIIWFISDVSGSSSVIEIIEDGFFHPNFSVSDYEMIEEEAKKQIEIMVKKCDYEDANILAGIIGKKLSEEEIFKGIEFLEEKINFLKSLK